MEGQKYHPEPISEELALKTCAEIREEYQGRWFSVTYWQCWGCERFSNGDPKKMCFHNQPGHRGCTLINRRLSSQ